MLYECCCYICLWLYLHARTSRNQAEAAKFFLGVNADVNAATTTNKSTPVIIAVAKGNKRVLDVLVSHPNVDLTLQV
jgi:ankyrin repeat protein